MNRHRLSLAIPAALLAVMGALSPSIAGRDRAPTELMSNIDRFALTTFGAKGARGALAAGDTARHRESEEEREEAERELLLDPLFTEYRTPNGWLLRPAGKQIDTSRAPTGVTVSPDNRTVVVVSSGIFNEDITVVDASSLNSAPIPAADLYMGAAVDPEGNLWVSTGSRNRIYHYRLAGLVGVGLRQGTPLFPQGTVNNGIPVIGYPGNMLLGSDGRLFVAGNMTVPESYIASKQKGARCDRSAICSVINVVDVSDPLVAEPSVRYIPVGRDAFGLALNKAKGKLYVTNWADETNNARAGGTGTVSVVDITKPGAEREVQVVPVGQHPTGIALSPDGKTAFVANTADDSLSKLRVGRDGMFAGTPSTIDVRTDRDVPRGVAPLALGFSADRRHLLVGLAGQNAVEVRTPSGASIPRRVAVGRGKNKTLLNVPHTYIPTGWYPSALTSARHPDGKDTRLYVANLKGIGAGPGANAQAEPFSGIRTQGTMSAIDLPAEASERANAFDRWTAIVVENNKWISLFEAGLTDAASDPCAPAPLPGSKTVLSHFLCQQSKAAGPSPYHVLYIVKENKTFDQYFGDINAWLPDADGSPQWLLYGDPVTTNQHLLARKYAVGDNFWADSEASTTGHSWTSAGYATDFNEITWNPQYSQNVRGNRWGGQYEGQLSGPSDERIPPIEGALMEPEERLVDLVANPKTNPRGVTYRVYSDDVNEDSGAKKFQVPREFWGLAASAVHRGRDLDFPDTDRANIFFKGETTVHSWSVDQGPPSEGFQGKLAMKAADREKYTLAAWTRQYRACRERGRSDVLCQRAMPNFIYMVLPVDHTLGFNPLSPTPPSMVADNDYATGLIIAELSKTPFWKNTLVLITEDDTQAAGDHVDSHRTFLLSAGGLARLHGPNGSAAHQAGSFPSVLKTVEVLFGLRHLTIYDRSAVPLHDFVVDRPKDGSREAYVAVRPPTPFVRNPQEGYLAQLSQMLDWRLDMTDPYVLRDLLYHGLRGWPLDERYFDLLKSRR